MSISTGKGSTVPGMMKTLSNAVRRDPPYEVVPQRKGAGVPTRADEELGWKAGMTLEAASGDPWKR